jgi:hypothetical protein
MHVSFQANSFENLANSETILVLTDRAEIVFLHGVNHPESETDSCLASIVIELTAR